MNEFALIADLAIIWCAALIAGYICIAAKQPVMAGYMLAGIAIGPHGLKLINQVEQIKVISEFGVAMLLFALGGRRCCPAGGVRVRDAAVNKLDGITVKIGLGETIAQHRVAGTAMFLDWLHATSLAFMREVAND